MLDGVLFETSYSEKNNEESVLGAMREPHFRLASRWVLLCYVAWYIAWYISCSRRKTIPFQARPSGLQHHRVKPEDHGSNSLFVDKGGSKTMLNEFIFCIVSQISSWQPVAGLEWTPSDYLGRYHGTLAPVYLWVRSLLEIWTRTASSAGCVQVLCRVPHVLDGCCSLFSDEGSARRLFFFSLSHGRWERDTGCLPSSGSGQLSRS